MYIEDGENILSLGYNRYATGYGKGLFSDCPLETLYLGRNLSYSTSSYYGYSPFYNKSTLTSVTIGHRVTSINDKAFYGCSGFTSIKIPNSIIMIGESAFYGCSGLTSATIGNSVISIGNYAFNGCTSLKELRIEDGDDTLSLGYNSYYDNPYYNYSGQGLFYDCPLERLHLGRDLSYKTDSRSGYSPFYGNTTLISVTIGNSVTSIGNYAFRSCSGFTSIEIPNSVTSIGDNAFYGCSGLTSATIGNSVISIGNYAFYGCSNLKTVTNLSTLTFTKGSTNNGYVAYYATAIIVP